RLQDLGRAVVALEQGRNPRLDRDVERDGPVANLFGSRVEEVIDDRSAEGGRGFGDGGGHGGLVDDLVGAGDADGDRNLGGIGLRVELAVDDGGQDIGRGGGIG